MCKVRYLLPLFIALLTSLSARAQFMDYGSDPSRFQWNIVRLPHYNLVYPQGTDSMAYKYALYLENAYPHIQKTVGKPIRAKFPVILHPGSMNSNGMVAWAPRRMELITTPSADGGVERWDKHLVLHESRHVFQTGKVMHGIFRPLYWLIGEQAAGVASFFLPTWYLEGDAVSTETAMSNGGRGRLPEFNMPYRAQMLGGKKFYSLDKWLLGSYKDYTGDYYALGYDLSSYARYRYGADVWDKTTSRYTRTLLFAGSFKHYTGSGIKRLYKETFAFLKEGWEKLDTAAVVAPRYLSPTARSYTSYRYPQALNDSTVVALQSGLKDLNALVTLTHGKEKRLRTIGNINSRITLRNGRVYWSERVPGLRWTHENYSVLKCYDISKDRLSTLTPRQRYLSPAIDPEGRTAAVSRPQMSGENQLVLVGLEEGKELAHFDTPQNAFIKELTFTDPGHVIAVAVDDAGSCLLELEIASGTWKELFRTTSVNITSPVWNDGKLYFESGANGTNNIYCLHPANRRVEQLTASLFGAFDPSFSADSCLLYSDYQARGYRIASLPADSLLRVEADFSQPAPNLLAETLAAQEQYNLDSAQLVPVAFEPERYRKAVHTFKFHSWAPFYYDVADAVNNSADNLTTLVKPGAMLLSQNTLNTATLQAGWFYDKKYHHGKLAFTYQGLFPVLDLSLDYGGKAFDMAWTANDKNQQVARTQHTDRNLLEAKARVYLPFNLTKNQWIRGIQPAVTYYFTNNRYQQYESRTYRNFQYVLPEVRFYNYRRQAQRDILPRLGYQLRLQYLTSPFNTENYGSLYAARLTTYLPGLVRNQGLMLRFGYQYQALDGKALYLPQQLLDGTRGYNYLYQTQQQWGFKADYALSLFTPDWNVGQLLYIRRFRTNLFYDLTRNQASKQGPWSTQSSYGADLIFDWNVLRMTYPLTTGVRLIQPIDYGKFQAELLFSVSF